MYKKVLIFLLCVLLCLGMYALCVSPKSQKANADYIKWVDFSVTASALEKAYKYDVSTYESNVHIDWIELITRCALKCGGNFKNFNLSKMDEIAEKMKIKKCLKRINITIITMMPILAF